MPLLVFAIWVLCQILKEENKQIDPVFTKYFFCLFVFFQFQTVLTACYLWNGLLSVILYLKVFFVTQSFIPHCIAEKQFVSDQFLFSRQHVMESMKGQKTMPEGFLTLSWGQQVQPPPWDELWQFSSQQVCFSSGWQLSTNVIAPHSLKDRW